MTNIYAQKVLDKNGFNRFQEFKLDAGKIANLYFRTSGLTRRVDNLYNLVDSRIDINGTVNAIKNNNLGGNLYFLSKEGMVVGSSGVINAGSLTVATPTDKYFTTMYAAAGSSNTGALSTLMGDITNNGITTIPINESGTISVLGKVNATDGITMRAAKVAVGKNVSGETVYGTAADATVAGASLKTGVTDFSSLVNTSGTSANLSGDLKATQTGNGDIVLSAYNNYNENHTNAFYSVHFTNTANVDAELTVANGASVQAAGKADLTAQAIHKTVTENYSAMLTYNESTGKYEYNILTQSAKAPLFGQNVATNATVNIDGTVTGNHVDIAAKATNKYSSAATSYAEDKIKEVLGDLGANVDVSWAYLDSAAEVNIGKTADISATGADTLDENGKVTEKALSIQATSTVDAGVGATAKNKSLLQQYTKHDFDPMPSSGVSITNTTNKATVS